VASLAIGIVEIAKIGREGFAGLAVQLLSIWLSIRRQVALEWMVPFSWKMAALPGHVQDCALTRGRRRTSNQGGSSCPQKPVSLS
jgi:hypothetical protein